MSTTSDDHAIVFVDLETTGLDHERDVITEMAWIYDTPSGETIEEHYHVRYDGFPSLWSARNTAASSESVTRCDLSFVLRLFFNHMLRLSEGGKRKVHLAGACPAFDDRFLRRHFRELPYHYHVIDVEAQAMGLLGWPVPRSLRELRAALGLPGENEKPHDALHDALEARLIYQECLRLSGIIEKSHALLRRMAYADSDEVDDTDSA